MVSANLILLGFRDSYIVISLNEFCFLFIMIKLLLKDKARQGEDFKESLARMKETPKAIVKHELSEFKVNNYVHRITSLL